MTDRTLLKGLIDGDANSFEKLFQSYYGGIARFAWRYVKDESVAESIAQEVFINIWMKREGLDPDGNIKTYLYRAARNRALDLLKAKRIQQKYLEQLDIDEPVAEISLEIDSGREELSRALAEAIEDLPQRAGMVLKLHRYEGLSYAEIAEIMDISVKTVESQMGRAFKLLRQALRDYLPAAVGLVGGLSEVIMVASMLLPIAFKVLL